jgi:hypothetical protein
VKTSAWVRWKGILLRKIQKITKQKQFAQKNVWFEYFEMKLLKINPFKNLKKINNEQQLYDASFLQAVYVC